MDTFILSYGYDYESSTTLGVFSTIEAAKEAGSAWYAARERWKPDYMDIVVRKLDAAVEDSGDVMAVFRHKEWE